MIVSHRTTQTPFVILDGKKNVFGLAQTSSIVKKHFSIRSNFISLEKEFAMINAHIKKEKISPVTFALAYLSENRIHLALLGNFSITLTSSETFEDTTLLPLQAKSCGLSGRSNDLEKIQYHCYPRNTMKRIILRDVDFEQSVTIVLA